MEHPINHRQVKIGGSGQAKILLGGRHEITIENAYYMITEKDDCSVINLKDILKYNFVATIDEKTIKMKAEYAQTRCLGGLMAWV